ncbi:MAG: ATP-dependent helicase, partial [Candidatus Oceanisphaera merdipullorum]|nr:ATP-dependent helicase [Candidatus Oceanisphaera merdipullorum]
VIELINSGEAQPKGKPRRARASAESEHKAAPKPVHYKKNQKPQETGPKKKKLRGKRAQQHSR